MLRLISYLTLLIVALFLFSCNEQEVDSPGLTGNEVSYDIFDYSDMSVAGTLVFKERDDNSWEYAISVDGIDTENAMASLVNGSAFENGDEIVELHLGEAVIDAGVLPEFSAFNDWEASFLVKNEGGDILCFSELGSLELTGQSMSYDLLSVNDQPYEGLVRFYERNNGYTLVFIKIENTIPGDSHPIHIHAGRVITGGGIKINFTNVNGDTGLSYTNIEEDNNGAIITFAELLEYDGYVTMHRSISELSVFLLQGNIGKNAFTGNEITYELLPLTNENISGMATFKERESGAILFTIDLSNTAQEESFPVHIHQNSAAEGGSIILPLNDIDGPSGEGFTEIPPKSEGGPFNFEELLNLDAFLNVHKSNNNFQLFVCQGDIGGNTLTGETVEYEMKGYSGFETAGIARISERQNGTSLIEMELADTEPGVLHPSHFHINSVAELGGIIINLNNVNGTTGIGKSQVDHFNSGEEISYSELIEIDGHLVVHKSPAELATRISMADVGVNVLTGEEQVYSLQAENNSGITGSVQIYERVSGFSLLRISLSGGIVGTYIAGIFSGSDISGGSELLTLIDIHATTGFSESHVEALNDGTSFTYSDLAEEDAHIRIIDDNGVVVASALIGSNG